VKPAGSKRATRSSTSRGSRATARQAAEGPSTDKVAIVTGGAAGIGRATALAMARQGIRVAVADVDELGARETVDLIADLGQTAFFKRTDVRRASDCERLVKSTMTRFGRLDIAFNNAGVVGPPLFTADYGVANWQRVIDVNLTGVFNCMMHELAVMKSSGGVIVNTASMMGLVGSAGGSAYCAAKHGVIGLTKAAALEYGRKGVRINAVCPGYVATDLTVGSKSLFTAEALKAGLDKTALRRIAAPEEVAAVVLWLCSDQASYVSGASYCVDGGFTAA